MPTARSFLVVGDQDRARHPRFRQHGTVVAVVLAVVPTREAVVRIGRLQQQHRDGRRSTGQRMAGCRHHPPADETVAHQMQPHRGLDLANAAQQRRQTQRADGTGALLHLKISREVDEPPRGGNESAEHLA